MWTPTTQAQHKRLSRGYGSDLTDAEWAILAPLLPPPCACGRKRRWPMRRIVEAMLYVLRGGCAWEMLPPDFPPPSTVYRWFARFRDDGTWEAINHHLVMRDRERVGRGQPVRRGARQPERQDGGGRRSTRVWPAKVLGRKRYALVDTDGQALKLHIHPADIQDRDGAVPLLQAFRPRFPFVELTFADSGYAGERVAAATSIAIEMCVRRPTRSASKSTSAAGSSNGSSPGSDETAAGFAMSSG